MAATECCSSSLFGFWTLCWCSTFTLFWLFSGLLWILVISCPDYSFLRYLEGYSCLNLAALIKDVRERKEKETTCLQHRFVWRPLFITLTCASSHMSDLPAGDPWVFTLHSALFSFLFLSPPSPCSFRWQLIGRLRLKCHPVLLALPHFAILFSQRVSVDMAGLPPGPRVGNLTQWLKNEPFLWFKRKLLKKTLAIKL